MPYRHNPHASTDILKDPYKMNINLLTDGELSQLHQLTEQSSKIVTCCHRRPDGDALGSSLAVADWLREKGKDVTVVAPDMFPDFLHWLPASETIVRYDKHPDTVEKAVTDADLIICLDFNDPERLGSMGALLSASKAPMLLIDHHPKTGEGFALAVSRPDVSSTCEIVARLLWQLGDFEGMSQKCAAAIYCGMMTDTGAFTYNSTAPEIYFIISQLLTKGIDKDRIYRNVYNNYSQWRLRLVGYVLYQKLNIFGDKHASYFVLTRNDLHRFHFLRGDAEGIVNMPLQIKGMRLSISLREDTESSNLVWVSLRSVGDLSCTKIAEKYFNGGGHLNASGGKLLCSIEEAEQTVRKAIMEEM